jgi:two-component system response regulator RegA
MTEHAFLGLRSILFVDDEVCVRASLAQWFGDTGWKVKTAACCAEASSSAAMTVPNFLVVEQWLPDGSGFQLFTRLRKLNSSMAGIVLTRKASVAAAVQAMRLGFLDYVAKPIDAERLVGHLVPSGDVVTHAAIPLNDVTDRQSVAPSLARLEWEHIHSVLHECCGNVSRAARVLGLPRRSLQRKLRRNGPPITTSPRDR